ncbi:MAG: hypothetical protein OEQ49_02215 [Myxococcales bacterium]|nr:hypothetical protein [Myxococcales bacterium]
MLLIATVGFACGHNKRANKTVLDRASFDFQCPKEEIELIVIDEEGARNLASQIAAHGCEKKAVYVFFPDVDTWVLNGSVGPAPVEHDPDAYHGKRKNKKEKRAAKKADKKAKKGKGEAEAGVPDTDAPALEADEGVPTQ